jgi:hypothetical protein
VSGDGLTGHVRDADPNLTQTIFASENVMALDWVMGLKMGVDPRRNSVIREALNLWGPVQATPSGDMTPWVPWRNVRPITVKVFDILEEFYWTSYVLSRTFASRQDPRFQPVSRWQWLFGGLQKVARALEGLAVKVNKLCGSDASPRGPGRITRREVASALPYKRRRRGSKARS